MTAIKLGRFGGEVPRITNKRKLASYSAQRAKNVDLTSGALSPIFVDPPFQSLHETDGTMKPGLDWGDLISIAKPDPVTVVPVDRIQMCRPVNWANIFIYVYVTYIDPSTNAFTATQVEFNGGAVIGIEYTDDGFVLYQRGRAIAFPTAAGVAYTVHGPIAQFMFVADNKYNGAPAATSMYPSDIDWATPSAPVFSMPMKYPADMSEYGTDGQTVTSLTQYTYGFLELVDYTLPAVEQQVSTEEDVASYKLTGGSYIASFRFRCNYVRGAQQFAYYLQSHVDQAIAYGSYTATSTTGIVRLGSPLSSTIAIPSTGKLRHENGTVLGDYNSYTFTTTYNFTMASPVALYTADDKIEIVDVTFDGGREGPPSDVSELVAVDPGEVLLLQTDKETTGCMRTRLYRSTSGAEGSFNLLSDNASEGTDAKYFDTFLLPLTEPLPPYGNYPQATKASALAASLYHPAQFGVIYYGNTVYLSDVFRPWAYPEEYTIAFPQQIIAGAISGNSILIFCSDNDAGVGKVYELSGNDPKFLAAYELSNAHPLLNKAGLAKIGQTVYWPTYDGIASTAGGKIELPTEKFFTREEWNEHLPVLMSSYTSENTLWLINATGVNWRMDFDEMLGEPFTFLGRFTAFSGEEFLWESKIFQYPTPIAWSHVRVKALEYPVAVEVFDGNGVQHASFLANDDTTRRLPRMRREKEWYLRIHGYHETTWIGVATSSEELVSE